jgi:hypothetical protein
MSAQRVVGIQRVSTTKPFHFFMVALKMSMIDECELHTITIRATATTGRFEISAD